MKLLTAYFTHEGENYVNGKLVNLTTGNTDRTAHITQALTGSDLYRIETKKTYPDQYMKLVREAKDELEQDARPALKTSVPGMEEYDGLILEYPNWWSTCPMAVFSFLETIDTNGLDIYPLCTHEGSGLADSAADIQKLCPRASVHAGLAVHGAESAQAEPDIRRWLQANGLLEEI